MGNTDRLATTGFARTSDRQLGLWDARNLVKPIKMRTIDASSGNMIPYYDADAGMLYLAGKVIINDDGR